MNKPSHHSPTTSGPDLEQARESINETARSVASSARAGAQDYAEHYVKEPGKDLLSLVKLYAKEKPDVAAAWAFALGIVVGWKIKP
jgi:hypothetical protein